MMSVPVLAGHAAQGQGVAAGGTVGWHVWLDGQVVGVSARHAICASAACANAGVQQGVAMNHQLVAKVYCVQPLISLNQSPGAQNVWDMGTAFYVGPTQRKLARGQFRLCADALALRPYPMSFSPANSVGPGRARFYKVGDGAPVCRTGTLRAAGLKRVNPLPNGQLAVMIRQLVFTRMSDSRDSGAVVVREADNTVAGLVWGASAATGTTPAETVANPFFRIGWVRGNPPTAQAPSGDYLPVFTRPAGMGTRCAP